MHVLHSGIGAGKSKVRRDFAHRGRYASRVMALADEIQNLALALGQLFHNGRTFTTTQNFVKG
jgi:hypothetical protein